MSKVNLALKKYLDLENEFTNFKKTTIEILESYKLAQKKLLYVVEELHRKISTVEKINLPKEEENFQEILLSKSSLTNQRCQPDAEIKKTNRNIVFHGLRIHNSDIKKEVVSFCLKFLHVKPNIIKARKVRCNSEIPPVIITVSDYEDKAIVFGNCHKLKKYKAKISITDDLSREERESRRMDLPSNIIGTKAEGGQDNKNLPVVTTIKQDMLQQGHPHINVIRSEQMSKNSHSTPENSRIIELPTSSFMKIAHESRKKNQLEDTGLADMISPTCIEKNAMRHVSGFNEGLGMGDAPPTLLIESFGTLKLS